MILLLLLLKLCSSKIISNRFTGVDVGYQGYFQIGNNGLNSFISIDMISDYSYISNSYKYDNNSIRVIKELDNNTKIIQSDIYFHDKFTVVNNFTMLMFDEKHSNKDGISFTHKYEDERFNFVNKLYEEKMIEKRRFGFYVDSIFAGILYFGGIDERVLKKYPYNFSCFSNYNDWSCNLYHIKYKDVTYYLNANTQLSFQANNKGLLVPYSFFSIYNKTVLQKYYDDNICSYELNNLSTFVSCKCSGLKSFPSLYLNLGDNNYITINSSELFQNYITNCYLLMSSTKNNTSRYEIGLPLIKKYIIQFDYDEDKIEFYSLRIEDIMYIKSVSYIKTLYLIIITLNIINIIINLYITK